MPDKKYKKEDCIRLLAEMYKKIKQEGEERFPRRADFSDAEVVAIKAFLGPWPRALEAAGIKPPRDTVTRKEKNREKRQRAKLAKAEKEKDGEESGG